MVSIVDPCCCHLQAQGLYHEYGGRSLLPTVGTYVRRNMVSEVPDDTAVTTIVSQPWMYYYWFRTNCHILQCGSHLTKLWKLNWMYMWGFASTVEWESSVPMRHSACSKQTITLWHFMLSVYSTTTLLYTCLPLTSKDNNTTNVVRGFELDLYGSEQDRQWTLRFHPCRWIPWPP